MAGALAIACFVKVFGSVFLGPSRTEQAARAREAPAGMRLAMLLLALGCILIGALPVLVMPVLDRVVGAWIRLDPAPPPLAELVPWQPLMAINAALVLGVLGLAWLLRRRARSAPPAQTVTWDCGYAKPAPSMAYTASSFAQILVGLYAWLLRPRALGGVPSELFPAARSFHSRVPEPVLESVLAPLWSGLRWTLTPLRAVQHGRIQQYLVYILLTLCVLLASLYPLGGILLRLVGW
jgi:hydrogenase-4 component B